MTDPAVTLIDPVEDTMTVETIMEMAEARGCLAGVPTADLPAIRGRVARAIREEAKARRPRGHQCEARYDVAVRFYIHILESLGLADPHQWGLATAEALQAAEDAARRFLHAAPSRVQEAVATVRTRRTSPRDPGAVEAVLLIVEARVMDAVASGGLWIDADADASHPMTAKNFRQALRVRGVDPALILHGRHSARHEDGRPSRFPQRARGSDPVATARRQVRALDTASPADRTAQTRRWQADHQRSQPDPIREQNRSDWKRWKKSQTGGHS
jgi:hypothetical protein